MTYFYPIYTDNEQKEGIWTLNSLDKTVIHLDSSITEIADYIISQCYIITMVLWFIIMIETGINFH